MGVDEIREKYLKDFGKEEGKIEGKLEMLIKQLIKKFKVLPNGYEEKIRTLNEKAIDNILTDIFDIEKIQDIEKYFVSEGDTIEIK